MAGAEPDDRAVEIIDFGWPAATEILEHGRDVGRRPKEIADLLLEISLEDYALARGDGEAFRDDEFF